jgi:3-phosphoshikimate 1-carboxyvinyltransferase
MSKAVFETLNHQQIYRVPLHKEPIYATVNVPGSKSVTNRALLMAALSKGKATLEGVLFSDDSRHFLDSLVSLGFEVDIDEEQKRVEIMGLNGRIPNHSSTIYVGSAGTAARFLTAMLALSEGEYTILCSEQMKKRPMKPLFDGLIAMGASFEYLEQEGFLPVKLTGNKGNCQKVYMDISKSSQFLSALLMVAPMLKNELTIEITSEKKEGAYIHITRKMMEDFKVVTEFDGTSYHVLNNNSYEVGSYQVEPDVSAACYFYSIAALTGGTMTVKGVHWDLMQGDIKFLEVLSLLGCHVEETQIGIKVTGPQNGSYQGIDVDMRDFSDQTMTLAVLAAYATSPTTIKNVAHIRVQECDRMQATINELHKIGVDASTDGENLFILPGPITAAAIETYEDHRMAMAFSLIGLKTEGIIIIDPLCCKKTFETYFDVFDSLVLQESSPFQHPVPKD